MSGQAPELRTEVKVYLEDTDALGLVYHANYLKFFERARTDWLEVHGHGLKGSQDMGFRFVVHKITVEYHRSAQLGDRLSLVTAVTRASPFRLVFDQRAFREGEAITSARVDIVCIDREGELAEIDETLIRWG
jgi:acyl-CoA thioester hydrolase